MISCVFIKDNFESVIVSPGRLSSLSFLFQHSQFVPVQVFLYLCKFVVPHSGSLEKCHNLFTFLKRFLHRVSVRIIPHLQHTHSQISHPHLSWGLKKKVDVVRLGAVFLLLLVLLAGSLGFSRKTKK